ncbi:MAG: group II intron reverse transcriptase/maturase [bacterium]|nr:group II intron reverse transcriptase/maturase [bacterium]
MDMELLRGCFEDLRSDAASGIDHVTKAMYAERLEENLVDLIGRLHRMAYIPQPVRRKYIPKPGSEKGRPLGIPALEDKLVQAGLVRILEQIYEQDFIDDSYGFRPGVGSHDALRTLNRTLSRGKIEWVVEADIKGFFDNVEHNWLMKFLGHRIGDKRVHRMVKRILKAGVFEEGEVHGSEQGTPQGGVISPLLANVYLHYVLDLWFERRFRRSCRGSARLIRYADDFVVCFAKNEEAERFRDELTHRLAEFGLEVEPSKTKVLAFGPHAAERAVQEGLSKPETFDFLGFNHYCSRSRDGRQFRAKRKTTGKKFRQKLAAFTAWLKANRSRMRTRDLWELVSMKLRGHYAYYGVTDNSYGINCFHHKVRILLRKWLNRRGGKRRMSWEKFNLMEKRFPLPRPRIQVSMF